MWGQILWSRYPCSTLAPKAESLLERFESQSSIIGSQCDALQEYQGLQNLLKCLHSAGQHDTQIWAERRTEQELRSLERKLRQRTVSAFERAKYDLVKFKNKDAIRADLLRPTFAEVSCEQIWSKYIELSSQAWPSQADLLSSVLVSISGCSLQDAVTVIKFCQGMSDVFAPIELANKIARQDWSNAQPFALGVALLPLVEEAIVDARSQRKVEEQDNLQPIKVLVFGGCCITAALAARLGCMVTIVEPRKLLRQLLEHIAEENGLSINFTDTAPLDADILVWEGIDDDTITELGYLPRIQELLKRRHRKKLSPPLVVPSILRINAALVDDSLPRVRGCDLSRFSHLRGCELCISHRWPRGACHLPTKLRSAPQHACDIDVNSLVDSPDLYTDRRIMSFAVEPGVAVSGVAFWIDAPLGNAENVKLGEPPGVPEKAWVACVQGLPPRKHNGPKPCKLVACLTPSKIWFEWCDTAGGSSADVVPVLPPVSNTRLPAWHFKMLNDHERNQRYDRAIARAIQRAAARRTATGEPSNPSVVDCGCGAGLLSVIAARSGASKVTGLELSPIISDITSETLSFYLREQKIMQSGSMTAPQFSCITADARSLDSCDVGKHDVIVSELMDASGIGESLLGVLQHACTHFANEGAQVIPCALELHGGIGWLGLPDCHAGVTFKALEPFYFASRRGGPFASASGVPSKLVIGENPTPKVSTVHSGPFIAKNANRLRRGENWDLLTEEVQFMQFDIESTLSGGQLYPQDVDIEVVVNQTGIANCIHWSWTVQLDEAETLSNRPVQSGGEYVTHWLQPFVPLGPLPVQKGDRLRIHLSLSDVVGQKLSISVAPAVPGSASAWAQHVKSEGKCQPLVPPEPMTDFLDTWKQQMDQNYTEHGGTASKYTSRGDVDGLTKLQQAVLTLTLCPSLFHCDPHIRDRLMQSYAGVSYK